jgi:predicted choloylglycine hydrolase
MLELTLTGSDHQRGLDHGHHFAEEIRDALASFKESLPDGDFAPAIAKTAELLDDTFPEINEQLHGISEAAGVSFDDVFLFNNRAIVDLVDETCSDVAVQNPDGTVIVGMNKDRPTPMNPYDKHFLSRIYPAEGYASIGYGHVGRIWGHGMNEKGLCTAGTAAHPLKNRARLPSFGSYFVAPLVLARCRDVSEALALLERIDPICDAGNYLFCDAAGDMAVVEVTPDQRVVRKGEHGRIVATTYFGSGRIEHRKNPAHLTESKERSCTIEDCLADQREITLAEMQNILRQHREAGPVCRHESTGVVTVFSWIALPQTLEFYFCDGLPCEGKYEKYGLE